MLEWLIVGGGVHGTALSNQLVKTRGMDSDKLCVVDPHDQPLAVWRHCTANTGMQFLRSPGSHSLDVGSGALAAYARNARIGRNQFFSTYERPSLAVFDSHCDAVIQAQQLGRLRYIAEATRLRRMKDGEFVLQTNRDELAAKRIILALGPSAELAIPDWARESDAKESIIHIFSPEFSRSAVPAGPVIVVGSGISAAQCALALSAAKPGQVLLLHSRPIRTRQFDADPCWLEQRCLKALTAEKDFGERRRIINNARHRGSFPEEIKWQLQKSVESGQLECRQGSVQRASRQACGVSITLNDHEVLRVQTVLLATGFAQQLPGGLFLQNSFAELNLRCAPCGFPITDRYLQWQNNLFVSGALAELTLGPAARNIIGARLAADRIFSVNRKTKQRPENSFYYVRKRRTG